METTTFKPENIDQYIFSQPQEIQPLLQAVRETIVKAAPEAVEVISYSMPAFKWHGKILAYFAAHKNHIGFYATPSANTVFKEELQDFKTSKGAVQLPYNKPIPHDLIEKMIRYKVNELAVSRPKKKQ